PKSRGLRNAEIRRHEGFLCDACLWVIGQRRSAIHVVRPQPATELEFDLAGRTPGHVGFPFGDGPAASTEIYSTSRIIRRLRPSRTVSDRNKQNTGGCNCRNDNGTAPFRRPQPSFGVSQSRFASGSRRVLVLLQPERKGDVNGACQDRVPTNEPDHCERTDTGPSQKNDAEGNREEAAEDEQPFTFDFLAQLDGAPDLEQAGDDRPNGDEHQQHQRG